MAKTNKQAATDYPGKIKEFETLVEEILRHHLANINGFLAYKYSLVPKGINSRSYWLQELHKHLFWAEEIEQSKEVLRKLKYAHRWQEETHQREIIEFNKRVNGLSNEPKAEAPKNPYPSIFKNGYAYSLFVELQELTVRVRTRVADYSFIYHKMKAKNIQAIHKTVTEPAFIQFLNKTYNTDIGLNKLPFRNPESKQTIYKATLKKHKGDIIK